LISIIKKYIPFFGAVLTISIFSCQSQKHVYYESELENVSGDEDSLLTEDEDINEVDLSQPVYFEDKNLEKCIKKDLAILEENDLLLYHISSLSSIRCLEENYSEVIKSLVGLEYAKELLILKIDVCEITDLSPLKKNNSLREIYLGNCSDLTDDDLEDIAHFTYLTDLDFSGSSVENLHKFRYKRSLLTLNLSDTNLDTTEYFVLFSNMFKLDISNNSGLESLDDLELWSSLQTLYAQNCNLTTISSFKYLHALKELDVSSNMIDSVSSLRKLTKLTNLNISENNISSIASLEQLHNIVNLDLSKNYISNINILKNLKSLSTVDITDNCINNDETIAELEKNDVKVINSGQKPDKCK